MGCVSQCDGTAKTRGRASDKGDFVVEAGGCVGGILSDCVLRDVILGLDG